MVEFKGHLLSNDEVEAVEKLLTEIRQKKEHERLVTACKMAISFEISNAISMIGLAETKTLVRELTRELREYKTT